MISKGNVNPKKDTYEDPEFTKIHPMQMMLYFLIASLTVLFLGLTVAYFFSKDTWTWSQFHFPKIFLLSTVVIVTSSFTIERSLRFYQKDKAMELKDSLRKSLLLTGLFIVLQIAGWFDLYSRGIYIAGKPDGSYLYVISGLHALHVIVGLGILWYFYHQSIQKLEDPVESLLFFTEAKKERHLKMIVTYWHFVDILWVYLLLFFLFNHL